MKAKLIHSKTEKRHMFTLLPTIQVVRLSIWTLVFFRLWNYEIVIEITHENGN
ncbi:hypothetical protein Barb6XT_02343 [Bacteroidales bacterium Barb6XT]|nr:hypothetical protein Barb6XT_02343 [Bacteroidales bacterium Barb6XT]